MAKLYPTRAPALRLRSPFAGMGQIPWGRALASERLLLVALCLLALLAHGLNMFNVPAFTFKDDEGIYAAQAWAVLRQGRLAPYTYWYDHAPAGWILIAGWYAITGGLHTFGNAIDSGRVLILILHVAMVPMLYHLVRKLGAGALAAALGALLFALSPLSIFYGRLLLLDTIMLFWTLLSMNLLLDGWGRLSRMVLSGICFGIAVLSKETAIFLLPALVLMAFHQRWEHHGRFAIGGWLLPMAVVVSWYPLYAMLKSELLPAGLALRFIFFNIETGNTVSLIDSLRWQATRTGGGPFDLNNLFWTLVRTQWIPHDPLLVAGGSIASVLNTLRGLRDRRALIAGLLGLIPIWYLGRGGVVFDYYILFAIPFLCLNLALLLGILLDRFPTRFANVGAAVFAAGLLGFYLATGLLQPLYNQRPGDSGRAAVAWIKTHLHPDSLIISRDDLWTDLREPGLGGPGFGGVHSHWKVAGDPEVYSGVFQNSGLTADYLIMSPGLEAAFRDTNDTVALEALQNASLVRRWESDGAEVELWKVNKPGATEAKLLAESHAAISARFERDGAFLDSQGIVTSEAQSYAMLRAVWLNDRPLFDRAWAWTQANLLDERGLLAWQWQGGRVTDPHTAADADTDTALALLMAGQRWNDERLIDAGRHMAQAIWDHQVVTVGGRPYLTAGDWVQDEPTLVLNPSYFAPYAYKVFAGIDASHDWMGLVETSYDVLFEASAATLGAGQSAGLPPDWVGLDRQSGAIVPITLVERDTTSYGYDAARTYWRVALDLRWWGDGRARSYLQQAGFLRDEVARKGYASAIYSREGEVIEHAPSMVSTAGALAALMTIDPALASRLQAGQVLGESVAGADGITWANPHDLYAQEWGWFAVALYADALPNLWLTNKE
jgi:endo-1,4-beta-D-glucanase Y/4-amino-4-deoxy-L-arabinose transferase-like glycosyltransferase